MRRWIMAALLAVSSLAIATVTEAEDAGPPSVRVRVIRPPEGSMRRGVLPVPDWVVYAGGGALALAAAGFLVWRSIRRR